MLNFVVDGLILYDCKLFGRNVLLELVNSVEKLNELTGSSDDSVLYEDGR